MPHVYLIHFEERLHHAGHYLGYSKMLTVRIWLHKINQGAKLIQAVNKAGIEWRVVRTWTVDSQELERLLKNQKNSPRYCPICNPALIGKVENQYQEVQQVML
jgi:predicted GIY-YIG superfamily endonuclease